METLYIHCAHYEPLMSLAKDNLPSLGSFLRKRYCTERRKDEASLWMSLELPALLSECKATTMPMVTNESYLPLSMDYTNVHSSASALALLPGPLNYLSTGFHLETFRGGGGISRVYVTLPVHHGQTQWLQWEPQMWPGRGSMPLKLPLSDGHRVELGTKTAPQPLLSCLQEFKNHHCKYIVKQIWLHVWVLQN